MKRNLLPGNVQRSGQICGRADGAHPSFRPVKEVFPVKDYSILLIECKIELLPDSQGYNRNAYRLTWDERNVYFTASSKILNCRIIYMTSNLVIYRENRNYWD